MQLEIIIDGRSFWSKVQLDISVEEGLEFVKNMTLKNLTGQEIQLADGKILYITPKKVRDTVVVVHETLR